MTIRTRLTLWFAAVLLVSLLAMGALCYYELVVEPRRNAASGVHLKGEEPPEEVLEALLWCGIPALILGLGGGAWLMRRTLAPIVALTQTAEQLTEHNLSQRLVRSGNGDELDRLTDVFNQMTARLEASFARIREFTLHASHELKTPLTVLHGEFETALGSEMLTDEQRKRLESHLDEIQRLTRIVDGLTLLTKADSGQLRLAMEAVPLGELIKEACADGQTLAKSKEIDVSVVDSPGELWLSGDRHRLRQLLLNLTDNAIKYNHPNGKVTLGFRKSGDSAQVLITNTGPGIEPALLPRVFDPFFRGDSSHSQTIEGCGLGLSIARWIVLAHGGTIKITSNPGELTQAFVTLPSLHGNGNGTDYARS
jgi:signal transduction histidine kinase